MSLQPLNDHVVLSTKNEEQVVGGIIIPETVDKKKPEQGTVVAVGPGKLLENGSRKAMSVAVGDKVVFKKYSADEVEVGKDEYLVIREEDILAIIK